MKFKDYLKNDKYENIFDGDSLFDKFDIITEIRTKSELKELYVAEEVGYDKYKKGEKLELTEEEQHDLWLASSKMEQENKFLAYFYKYEQMTESHVEQTTVAKVFDINTSMQDVLDWARSNCYGLKIADIKITSVEVQKESE